MASAAEQTMTTGPAAVPYPITADLFERMLAAEIFPPDDRVFLWGGRLYEKVAKSLPQAAVQSAFIGALSRRLPPGLFVGPENPVRLDATHVPLPDLIVAVGEPLDFYDTRYPDGRDVLLVVEVALSSLPEDLGARLDRYARTLPHAAYVVADIPHRRALVHTGPRTDGPDAGTYEARVAVGPGAAIRLRLGTHDLEPIPFEEVMRRGGPGRASRPN